MPIGKLLALLLGTVALGVLFALLRSRTAAARSRQASPPTADAQPATLALPPTNEAWFRPIGEIDRTFRPVLIQPAPAGATTEAARGPCWVCGRPKDGHRHA